MFGGTDQSMMKLRMSHLPLSFIGTRLNALPAAPGLVAVSPGAVTYGSRSSLRARDGKRGPNMHTGARQRG